MIDWIKRRIYRRLWSHHPESAPELNPWCPVCGVKGRNCQGKVTSACGMLGYDGSQAMAFVEKRNGENDG